MASEVFCADAHPLHRPSREAVPVPELAQNHQICSMAQPGFFLQARRALPRNLTAACLFPYKKHRVCL